jgi:sec-independent protein translocase protein TatB
MVRQSELEELEKKWAAENERIMREHPAPADTTREYDSLPPPEPEVHVKSEPLP